MVGLAPTIHAGRAGLSMTGERGPVDLVMTQWSTRHCVDGRIKSDHDGSVAAETTSQCSPLARA